MPHLPSFPLRSPRALLSLGLALVLVLGAGLALVVPRIAHAASLSVTDCSAYGTSSQAGTLAKALNDAATNADTSNTITFACDTNGSGLVFPAGANVTKNLTLDASGHSVTLNGNNATQLFGVSLASLTLTHLTLTQGVSASGAGGAIHIINGTLTITDCTFTSNSAGYGGAITALGSPVTISGSRFESNSATGLSGIAEGGAIYLNQLGTTDALTITDTTFAKNSATVGGINPESAIGGAIMAGDGTASITTSTFTENVAGITSAGPGIVGADGGALFLADSATITQSTFANNSANAPSPAHTLGGAIYTSGSLSGLTLANSTVTGNDATAANSTGQGGGLFTSGTTTLTNDTIDANTVGGIVAQGSNLFVLFSKGGFSTTVTNTILANGADPNNCSGTLVDGGHNLDSGTSCGFSSANHDLVTTNPQLDTLAPNGGPTQTQALLTGSPAIDAGSDTACAASPVSGVDQRGTTRPQGPHCDIGAYEVIPATTTTLTTSTGSAACGAKVTLTATVASTAGTPTGTVTFKDGGKTLGTASLAGGKATLTTSSLSTGSHSLTATYNGGAYAGSTSKAVSVTVGTCHGLDGVGAPPSVQNAGQPGQPSTPKAPASPQQPPSASQGQQGQSGSSTAPVNSVTGGNGSATPTSLPLLPLLAFVLLMLLVGGGLFGFTLWRRRQSQA